MSMRVINWEEYTSPNCSLLTANCSLAVTIGVFDGVHLGHQALIRRICSPPASPPPLPTVVTFRQNPLKTLMPSAFPGDILSLEQKLGIMEALGVQLAVLIDFTEKFSRINGRDFVGLLLDSRPVKLIALGRNFRCGHGLDTGVGEIQGMAEARGVEIWIAQPVMDEGQPVSSSRIRQALAAGRKSEAERLLARSIESPL